MDIKTNVAILGAGPAGLSAAYHLKGKSILIEKEDRVGGLARSKEIEGFVFDYAGHIFFTQDRYASKLFKKLLGDNINFKNRDAWVYSKNIYTRYPFQANTYGLPKGVIMDCIIGLMNAKNGNGRVPRHFEEWMDATFGEGIVRHFMKPYNQKVWAFPLNKMTYEWISDRVMMPYVKEVIEGALKLRMVEFGPNSKFAYPLKGGSQALADSFLPHLKKTDVLLNSEVVEIDLKEKVVMLEARGTGQGSRGKKEIGYEKLISSLPLPLLIALCNKVPKNVKKAAEELNVIFQKLLGEAAAKPSSHETLLSEITADDIARLFH